MLALVAVLLAGPARAHDDEVARVVYLSLEGVTGDSTDPGHEGQFKLRRYGETWRAATDATTGQVTGKLQLGPLVFTTTSGHGTFELKKLMTTNRVVPKATFEFLDGAEGKPLKVTARVTLTSARVAAVTEQTVEGRRVDEVQLQFRKGKWEVLDPADSFDFDASPTTALTGGTARPPVIQ